MSQIITAPDKSEAEFISVFLAGGITNCENWQDKVIKELEFEDVTVFNPRQPAFDITDKAASIKQITWEYERLEKMDIFSMYFCGGESDQPICMYELGRNILRMQNRFPNDWERRIVVSVESDYKRKKDVLVQIGLCAPKLHIDGSATPEIHAQYIRYCVKSLKIYSYDGRKI